MSKTRANANRRAAAARAELKHDDPVLYDVLAKRSWAWRQVERLASSARSEMARLRALEFYLERTDPKPTRALLEAQMHGPVTIRWDMTAPEIPPASARMAPSATSSDASNGSTSLSAIADGERPPSA